MTISPKYLSPYITTVVDGVKTYTRRELGRAVPCILITKFVELGHNMASKIFRDMGYDPFENGEAYYEWSINTGKYSMPDIWAYAKTVKDAKKSADERCVELGYEMLSWKEFRKLEPLA